MECRGNRTRERKRETTWDRVERNATWIIIKLSNIVEWIDLYLCEWMPGIVTDNTSSPHANRKWRRKERERNKNEKLRLCHFASDNCAANTSVTRTLLVCQQTSNKVDNEFSNMLRSPPYWPLLLRTGSYRLSFERDAMSYVTVLHTV